MADFRSKSAMLVHVTAIGRTNESINKAEDAGRIDAQIGIADALRRIFPTGLANHLQFHGWTR